MIKKSGLETAARVMGGINNIIDIVYDGDLIKFSEDTYNTNSLHVNRRIEFIFT
jgi:hypothetical protein